jgi:hypothetical protein
MGGHVAKKLGDVIMARFGHPIAQENDAERAVRAALVIRGALAGDLGRRKRIGGRRWTDWTGRGPDPSSGALLRRYDVAI